MTTSNYKTVQQLMSNYKTGFMYQVINSKTVVFDNLSQPHFGPNQEEFLNGYMLSNAITDPYPTNMLCVQVVEKYIQFLWGEKTIWIFVLDANACLRPLFSGYNQIK